MDKPVRLKSIAEKLGISLSTVSRVLNDKPGISKKTRDLVMEELRTQKNDMAPIVQANMTSRGQFIGIIGRQRSYDLDAVYFHHSTLPFDEIFHKEGFQTLAIPVTDKDMENPQNIPALQSSSCEGFILRGQSLTPRFSLYIKSLGKPVVLLESRLTESPMNCVICEDFKGAKVMTKHLIEMGHKEIIHISGPEKWYNNRERINGYKRAMKEAGLVPNVISRNDTTIQTGGECFGEIYSNDSHCTAVFAVNDAMAIGLMNRCHREGVKIPEDLTVAGFDDIPWASMSNPPLTSSRIYIEKMGQLAAMRILQLLKDPDSPPVEMKMPVELKIRESSKKDII